MSRKPDFRAALGYGAIQAAVLIGVVLVMGERPVSEIEVTGWIGIFVVWVIASLVIGGLHSLLDRHRGG